MWSIVLLLSAAPLHADEDAPGYTIEVSTPVKAPADHHWMQVRAGVIPAARLGRSAKNPRVVVVLQLSANQGTHMYGGLNSMWTDTLGESWHGPKQQPTLARRKHDNGLLEVPVDTTAKWHRKSSKLLLTGATFWLDPQRNRDVPGGPSDTAYSVYDTKSNSWLAWRKLQMPDDPRFKYARAGCTQWVELANGDILLPIYFGGDNNSLHLATVVRCSFDGKTLRYIEHGDELTVDFGRGFGEPSLAYYRDKYYLTLRNDRRGYIATSDDGLHFGKPRPWQFDDGSDLGSYNTQQHWVTHSNGLYLVYTRRGLDNDEIFRHRAPLMMAQVDTTTLRVVRSSEQKVLPKLQGGFGNFGVCAVSAQETWITAGRRAAKQGEPSVYVARVRWPRPNQQMQAPAEPR